MNGYQIHIDAYKRMLESNDTDIDRDFIKAEIKALEPFAERTEEERLLMFNSGAYNEVLKAYCRKAMQNCKVNDEIISNVMNEIKWLLDTVGATEIIKN